MHPENWLQLRTFSHNQFSDPIELLKKKKYGKHIISLCLPALNEAKTIGKIIKTLKKSLHDKVPLLDEIVVIDSGSTDGTQEIAKKQGVQVFQSSEILPEFGNYCGKGENLWKSLYIANGDIVIWLDTDIRNIHPRFVYRRPIEINGKLKPTGGGRVTEILVKPFFNLMFPQLAMFHQPLAGEYAGRRELLERVPFFTGYGVETGLMVDIESRFGLNCMAQVDLEVRIHRNQSLESLRKMAFGILKVLLMRAEQQGKLVLLDTPTNHFISVVKTELENFEINFQETTEIERPPIIFSTAYQRKRHLSEEDLVLLKDINKNDKFPFVSISPFLDPKLIILDGQAESKEEVLQEIGSTFYENGYVKNYHKLIEEFYTRESTFSTGIGSGIAIPHVLSTNIQRMAIAVYRSTKGIQFEAFDGQPVSLIFAVICPTTRRRQYLQILANLAILLKDKNVRSHLHNAQSEQEFINKLRKIEVVKKIEWELRLVES